MFIYCQKKWNTIVFHNIKRTLEINIPKLFLGGYSVRSPVWQPDFCIKILLIQTRSHLERTISAGGYIMCR